MRGREEPEGEEEDKKKQAKPIKKGKKETSKTGRRWTRPAVKHHESSDFNSSE